MRLMDERRDANHTSEFHELVILNSLSAIKKVQSQILAEVEQHGYDEEARFAIAVGLTEAFANAYSHGNKQAPEKRIRVRYRVDCERAEIEITDEGEGFDPGFVPDPTTPENICHSHGRGLALMKALLDDLQFTCSGTRVRLVKLNRTRRIRNGRTRHVDAAESIRTCRDLRNDAPPRRLRSAGRVRRPASAGRDG